MTITIKGRVAARRSRPLSFRKRALVINDAVVTVIATSIRAISDAVGAIGEKELACWVESIAHELTSWITRRSSIRFAHRADIRKEALVISGAVVTVSYSREIGKKELGRWVESIAHEPTGGITRRRSSIKLACRADLMIALTSFRLGAHRLVI
jgi:hypothetical protein